MIHPDFRKVDLKSYEERTMVYKKEAMKKVKEALSQAGFEINAEREEFLMFDYNVPSGHIEFSVEITGWGHAVGKEDNEAGA
jgi:hypothetical protein